MLKSDLVIEPYTIDEALDCINKEFKIIKRKTISRSYLRKLIYNTLKIPTIKSKRRFVMIQYNSIVDIYSHILKAYEEKYLYNGRRNKRRDLRNANNT